MWDMVPSFFTAMGGNLQGELGERGLPSGLTIGGRIGRSCEKVGLNINRRWGPFWMEALSATQISNPLTT